MRRDQDSREKTVRLKSLAVDVEEMVSELSEAAKPWITS